MRVPYEQSEYVKSLSDYVRLEVVCLLRMLMALRGCQVSHLQIHAYFTVHVSDG